MLAQIGIRYQDNEASVEKLSDEKSKNHAAILSRKWLVTDPLYQAHDRETKYDVDSNDNERNRDTENKGPVLIISNVETNRLLKDDFSLVFQGVFLTNRLFSLLLSFAEAL